MLLQDRWEYQSTASFMTAGGAGTVLMDGVPLVPFGSGPIPPAASRSGTSITDPLSSGLWGGGRWCMSASRAEVPDSAFETGISLLQNTEVRSRYGVYLRRRVPPGMLGGFYWARGDSAAVSLVDLERGPATGTMVFWRDGYSLGGGYAPGPVRTMAGFSRLFHGDRRPWVLAELRSDTGRFFYGAGAGAAWTEPSIHWRTALSGGAEIAGATVSLNGEMNDGRAVLCTGIRLPGALSLGVVIPDSGRAGGFASGGLGAFSAAARINDVNRAAVSAALEGNILRGSGGVCWDFDRDSLSLSAWVLPGVNWYRARLEAGGRIRGGVDDGGWQGTVDALAGFTLRTFSFALALEDVTDATSRSWTFGVTWSFSEKPPVFSGEEGADR